MFLILPLLKSRNKSKIKYSSYYVSNKTIEDVGEFGFIEKIKSKFTFVDKSVHIPIGDDAALLDTGKNNNLILVTTDLLVEDVDFSFNYCSASNIAFKAIAANVSDITAMGGLPRWFTVSLGLPSETSEEFLDSFYDAICKFCTNERISLIGGDLSESCKFLVSITMLGLIEEGLVITRDGAKVGDTIFLIGGVGFSSLGLIMHKYPAKKELVQKDSEFVSFCMKRHLNPPIRSKIGQFIANHKIANAMIDISDGLFKDLWQIARTSHVGAFIDILTLPYVQDFKKLSNLLDIDFKAIISGGEDFELLFTVSQDKIQMITDMREEFPDVGFYEIGKIVDQSDGLKFKDLDGNIINIELSGYEHFKKNSV
jgi:thiamine-monophosphate kinase